MILFSSVSDVKQCTDGILLLCCHLSVMSVALSSTVTSVVHHMRVHWHTYLVKHHDIYPFHNVTQHINIVLMVQACHIINELPVIRLEPPPDKHTNLEWFPLCFWCSDYSENLIMPKNHLYLSILKFHENTPSSIWVIIFTGIWLVLLLQPNLELYCFKSPSILGKSQIYYIKKTSIDFQLQICFWLKHILAFISAV